MMTHPGLKPGKDGRRGLQTSLLPTPVPPITILALAKIQNTRRIEAKINIFSKSARVCTLARDGVDRGRRQDGAWEGFKTAGLVGYRPGPLHLMSGAENER